jgi:RNA polymerase sigma factor (sigma-70 family)
LTQREFQTYQEQTFDSYINKLIKNESKDAKKAIARRSEREISLSQLMQDELAQIATTDTYDLENATFHVKGDSVIVHDVLLGQAIAALPPQRRDVILLSYFMGQNDPQIGTLLHLEPQTIRYRRQTALQRLKEILENLDYEK